MSDDKIIGISIFGSLAFTLIMVFTLAYMKGQENDQRYVETNATIAQDVANLTHHERQLVIVEKQLADVSVLLIRTGKMSAFDEKFRKTVREYRKDPLNPYQLTKIQDEIHRLYVLYSLK